MYTQKYENYFKINRTFEIRPAISHIDTHTCTRDYFILICVVYLKSRIPFGINSLKI